DIRRGGKTVRCSAILEADDKIGNRLAAFVRVSGVGSIRLEAGGPACHRNLRIAEAGALVSTGREAGGVVYGVDGDGDGSLVRYGSAVVLHGVGKAVIAEEVADGL